MPERIAITAEFSVLWSDPSDQPGAVPFGRAHDPLDSHPGRSARPARCRAEGLRRTVHGIRPMGECRIRTFC